MKFIYRSADTPYYRYLYQKTVIKADVYFTYGFNLMRRNKYLNFLFRLHTSRRINSKIKLPFKNIWNRLFTPVIEEEDTVCFIFTSLIVTRVWDGYFNYLKKRYNAKIVVLFTDKIEYFLNDGGDIDYVKNKADMLCTFNLTDAKKYKIQVHPPMVFEFKERLNLPYSERPIDVLFIGREKGRGKEINDAYHFCRAAGLNCSFFVVGDYYYNYDNGILFSEAIPYEDVINKVMYSKCILNILQKGANGITLRDMEAYNFGCCLLSSNPHHELLQLFHKEQIFNLENPVDLERLILLKKFENKFDIKQTDLSFTSVFEWIDSYFANN